MEKRVNNTYYKVALVGASGKGKTYSLRDLDPETTGYINIEHKPLPFLNKFKHYVETTNFKEAYDTIIEYGKNPEITSIVVDSFSAYVDSLLAECRKTKRGFDVWSEYASQIGLLLILLKRVPKHTFITAHYEMIGIEGDLEKRIKVKGKEWEGLIEKEFTVVLYAASKKNDKGKPEYTFNLYEDNSSAKCPPDIFGEDVLSIPNDSNAVLTAINTFINKV